MKITHDKGYQLARRLAYPPIEDGLDALVQKELGDNAPWMNYVVKCKSVKDNIPKVSKKRTGVKMTIKRLD